MKIVNNRNIIEDWINMPNSILVVPCNKGNKKNGENVMGRGIALEVAKELPYVPKLLGDYILSEIKYANIKQLDHYDEIITPKIHYPTRLYFFFTKERNWDIPHLSFKNNSTLKSVENNLIRLQYEVNCSFNNKYIFLLPKVGCGNGGLDYDDVKPLIQEYLEDFDNVVLYE